MKRATFYALVSVAYLALTLADRRVAETVFPFVALVLLLVAMYCEGERMGGRR